MKIAIALVLQDHFDRNGAFVSRYWMTKRISKHNGCGRGLPGFEITPETLKKDIPMLLKNAIDNEKTGIVLVGKPRLYRALNHEGDTVFVYLVNFLGQAVCDISDEDVRVLSDLSLSSYKLTNLAQLIIDKAPKPKYQQNNHCLVRTRAF